MTPLSGKGGIKNNNKMESAQTPLSDLRNDALSHYEEAAASIHCFSSELPKAINFYYDYLEKENNMTSEILTSENLIKIEENLNKFKEHYQRKGAEKCHRLIKEKIKDDTSPRDSGIPNHEDYYRGYDKAVSDILSLLRDNLIFAK